MSQSVDYGMKVLLRRLLACLVVIMETSMLDAELRTCAILVSLCEHFSVVTHA